MASVQSTLLADPALRPDPSRMIRLMNGRQVDSKTVRENAAVVACGSQLPSSNAIYGFRSDEEFQEWCEGLPIADSVHRAYRMARRIQDLEKTNLTQMEAAWRETCEAKAAELQRLALREDVADGSREQFDLATGGGATPRVIGLTILYSGVGFSGKVRPIPIAIPRLKTLGIDDQVSSMRAFGAGFLAADTFFRGKKFFYFGIPGIDFADLRDFDYDDKASSILVS